MHEIKHARYRLQVRRDGDARRWTGRYPAIASAISFTLDGEAVVCGPDRVAVFDTLHRRGTVSEGDALRLRPA
jgi:ATP-dependent DNA ligase